MNSEEKEARTKILTQKKLLKVFGFFRHTFFPTFFVAFRIFLFIILLKWIFCFLFRRHFSIESFQFFLSCVCTFHLTNERKWNAIYGLWMNSVWVRVNRANIHQVTNVSTIAHSFDDCNGGASPWNSTTKMEQDKTNEKDGEERMYIDREWGRCNLKAYTILY